MIASNCCLTSSGSGAPPQRQNFSEDRSALLILGWFISALKRVGTPGSTVGRVLAMRSSASSSEKRGMMMISAPLATPRFMTTVSAKTWKNGSTPSTRSSPSLRSVFQAPTWCTFT